MYFPSVASDALSGPLSLAQLGCRVNFRCREITIIKSRAPAQGPGRQMITVSQLDREIANQVEDRAYGFTPIF
jgi:hypothetical protein